MSIFLQGVITKMEAKTFTLEKKMAILQGSLMNIQLDILVLICYVHIHSTYVSWTKCTKLFRCW